MKCQKCGSDFDDNLEFCPNCGAPAAESFSETPPEAEEPVPEAQEPAQEYAVVPEAPRKKNRGVKIAVIVGACVVLLAGGGFFTVKSFFMRDFLQTVYGKENYSKGLEKTTAQSFGSGVAAGLGRISEIGQQVQKSQAASDETTLNLKLEDGVMKALGVVGQQKDTVQNIVGYVNSLKIKTDYGSSGGKAKFGMQFSDKDGSLLTANGFLDGKNHAYFQLPEISKTYFGCQAPQDYTSYLSQYVYDEGKIKQSMGRLTDIAAASLDQGKTSVGSDTQLNVRGISCSGEKVTVSLNASQTGELLGKLASAIGSDDYFYKLYAANQSAFFEKTADSVGLMDLSREQGSLMTRQEFKDSLDKWGSRQKDEIQSTVKEMSFTSYVTPQNQVVGQSMKITRTDGRSISADFLTAKDGGRAFDITLDGSQVVAVVQTVKSQKDGDVTFWVTDPDVKKSLGFHVAYRNFQETTVMGQLVWLGNFTANVNDPDGLIKSSMEEKDLDLDISGTNVTISRSLSGSRLSMVGTVNLKGLLSLQINSTQELKTGGTVEIPSIPSGEVISMDSSADAEQSTTLQKQYEKDTIRFLAQAVQKHKDLASALDSLGLTQEMLQAAQSVMD